MEREREEREEEDRGTELERQRDRVKEYERTVRETDRLREKGSDRVKEHKIKRGKRD